MLRGILVRIQGLGMGAERVKNRSDWVYAISRGLIAEARHAVVFFENFFPADIGQTDQD